MVKKLISMIFLLFAFRCGWAHAELALMKVGPELQEKIKSLEKNIVQPYVGSHGFKFFIGTREIKSGFYDFSDESAFAWILDGDIFYSNIPASYRQAIFLRSAKIIQAQ